MKSYVACFFFTLQTFCWKKKTIQFLLISANISYALLIWYIIWIANSALSFYPPGEESSFHSIFFFLVENIRLFAEKKTNKTETIFPIFWPKHNTKNLWKPEEQNIGERRPPHTHKAQPNVTTALMQFIACRLNFFFLVNGTRWTSTKCTIFYPPFDCTVLILYGYEKRQNFKKRKMNKNTQTNLFTFISFFGQLTTDWTWQRDGAPMSELLVWRANS